MSGRSLFRPEPGALAAVCIGSDHDVSPADRQYVIPSQAAEPDAPAPNDADAPTSADTEKAL